MTAAMLPEKKRAEEPKGVRELLDLIHLGQVDPEADAKSRVESAVEANVLNSFSQIKHVDAKAEGLRLRKSELLVAAVYELSTGRVRILDKYQDPH